MKEVPRPQQDTCFNAQGVPVRADEANCVVQTADGVTLSAFQDACPNGMDFVTIQDAQGNMIPLFSNTLCYVESNLRIEDGDVIFHGENEHGIYETTVAPANTPTPETAYATPVLIPTHTPLETTTTMAQLSTPQPLIEIQPAPQHPPNCLSALALLALPLLMTAHNRYINRKR